MQICKCFSSRFKLWTGWRARPVGCVVGLMGRWSRSSVCPADDWPRARSATLIPGPNLEKAAGSPLVNMIPTQSFFKHRAEALPSFCLFAGCLMKHESVKLDKQIFMEGEESKCYSVEPVLRCLPGCVPLRTTQVKIGFHCVPAGEPAETLWHTHTHGNWADLSSSMLPSISIFADARLNRSEMQNSMFGKSIDVREKAEAHLACRCSPQCS